MNKMNTLAFVNFLLVELFLTLIRQNFPPSKICAIRYSFLHTYLLATFIFIVPLNLPTLPSTVTPPPGASAHTINVALPPPDQIDTGEL